MKVEIEKVEGGYILKFMPSIQTPDPAEMSQMIKNPGMVLGMLPLLLSTPGIGQEKTVIYTTFSALVDALKDMFGEK